ncbi:ROK family transcriptional regulator [Paenibacillus polysaccharolyticus]|uniref:ROK family transcriptional regulator n=1 Tax=Paenibacillus cucumis (ex Kampfer et al. 2016) TaxID=1776858 RepID=A0ABS7KHA7_9BACL|nr:MULTISPECIES: ROK family transcriptional regulator [Paenibacillus]MBY0203528.1 ROK family transcriptional regulator [Paenibacillus cucumis (ex Kampfer et al. 2016)]MCM3136365.1 ROK family transcriptional regulator [Paenibacillus polysaccharolyticus]MCP1131893.1 ROK family transcriptional regulator [Paenibacillus polysaccharolyticus]
MKITGDQMLVKKINKSIVLDTIRRHAPLSRAKLSEVTGLNKATVSNLVADLISDELVQEIGPGESSGGRKPLMLLFRGTAGYAVGLELSVTRLKGVLTDLEGHIVAEYAIDLEQHDATSVFEQLKLAASHLIKQAPPSPHGVIGIGIGVPGMVDEQGTVLFAPNLKWEMVPLRSMMEESFNLPVTIDNEANAGARGELNFGAGVGVRHLIYISAGIGIGSGIMVDGELYKGAWGYAGETGHMSIEAEGLPCSCGNRGCWELYASEKVYEHPDQQHLPAHTTKELIEHAQNGHQDVIALYNIIGRKLGVGITNIVNSFNPERIIIGGPLSEAKPWIESALKQVVEERTLPYHRRSLQVEWAALGSRSTRIGAAYSAISQFLGNVRVSV